MAKAKEKWDTPARRKREKRRSKNIIYTIGYSNRSFKNFYKILSKKVGVPCRVIDIRISRKSRNPDFDATGYSKFGFESQFKPRGIWYYHYPELGNPTRKLNDFKIATVGENFLKSLVNNLIICPGITVLMCVEKDWRKCHRKIIARFFKEKLEWKIYHLE